MVLNTSCFKIASAPIDIKEQTNKETKDENIQTKLPFFKQFMSISSGYILMVAAGTGTTWSSPALPYLTSKESGFELSITQGAWLVSISSFFGILAYILCAILPNRIGRKFTILLFGIILLLAMITVNSATTYKMLFFGRAIFGIGSAGTYSILTLYIGEISHENLRGRFLTFDKMSVNIGAFLMTSAGAFFSYENMNLFVIFIPLIGIAIFPVTSETPYYYLLNGNITDAIDTRMKLMETDKIEDVTGDIARMKKAIDEGNESKKSSVRELFLDRGSRRALILKVLASITYSLSGYLAIQAYAQNIFSSSGFQLRAEFCVMIMTGAQILAGLPSSQIVDFWGRRPTFLLSGILSSFSLTIVGFYFFLKSSVGVDVSSVTWIPLVGLLSFTFSCNIGLTTIPYLYLGELFSVKVKGAAAMISLIFESAVAASAKMMFPLVCHSFGIYASFWVFAITCLLGSIAVFLMAPETKGKNLEEVLQILRSRKRKFVSCDC